MSVQNVLYRAQARATGGRDGRATSLDGALDLALSTPKALGGAGGAGSNPEQLFAAGYAACFIGALKVVAAMKRPAAELTPTPESGRPYGFVENVQPIFDAKCVRCHNDKEAKGGINLSRTLTGANGYTVTPAAVAVDASVSCTLTQTNGGNTATFIAIGIN